MSLERRGEHFAAEADQGRAGPVVARENARSLALENRVGRRLHEPRIRALEAEDRLLLVPDPHGASGEGRQGHDDLELHGGCVLELIDHDQIDPPREPLPRLGATEDLGRLGEHVLEVEQSLGLLSGNERLADLAGVGEDLAEDRVQLLVEAGVGQVLREGGTEVGGDRLGGLAGPVRTQHGG